LDDSISFAIPGKWMIKGKILHNVTSEAPFCICTHQYMEFQSKLFWAIQLTYDAMCQTYWMMVLALPFLKNG
jgi:hypothetical protein